MDTNAAYRALALHHCSHCFLHGVVAEFFYVWGSPVFFCNYSEPHNCSFFKQMRYDQ